MMVKKKRGSQEIEAVVEPAAVEETIPANELRANLEEIKTYDGVVGYILRNSSSAAIDLKDPSKIIDYAIISSSALDAGEELSEVFDLGAVKNIIVEGKAIKVLSLTVDENRISVFLEKDADCEKILKKLQ
jgi:predicted regulator of Ras-like GTPase activity (Roadblock/LC7/MglB family)